MYFDGQIVLIKVKSFQEFLFQVKILDHFSLIFHLSRPKVSSLWSISFVSLKLHLNEQNVTWSTRHHGCW